MASVSLLSSFPHFDVTCGLFVKRHTATWNLCVTLNRPFPSSFVPLFQNESKSETFRKNEFCMQFHFHPNQRHFKNVKMYT